MANYLGPRVQVTAEKMAGGAAVEVKFGVAGERRDTIVLLAERLPTGGFVLIAQTVDGQPVGLFPLAANTVGIVVGATP